MYAKTPSLLIISFNFMDTRVEPVQSSVHGVPLKLVPDVPARMRHPTLSSQLCKYQVASSPLLLRRARSLSLKLVLDVQLRMKHPALPSHFRKFQVGTKLLL